MGSLNWLYNFHATGLLAEHIGLSEVHILPTGLDKSCQANIVGTIILHFSHHLHPEKIILAQPTYMLSPLFFGLCEMHVLPLGFVGKR